MQWLKATKKKIFHPEALFLIFYFLKKEIIVFKISCCFVFYIWIQVVHGKFIRREPNAASTNLINDRQISLGFFQLDLFHGRPRKRRLFGGSKEKKVTRTDMKRSIRHLSSPLLKPRHANRIRTTHHCQDPTLTQFFFFWWIRSSVQMRRNFNHCYS